MDDAWKQMVATLDSAALRTLLAEMHLHRQDIARRMDVVRLILALDPEPQCDCDHRWCTTRPEHDPTCALLGSCTCERRWLGGGQLIATHARHCALRTHPTRNESPWPPPRKETA